MTGVAVNTGARLGVVVTRMLKLCLPWLPSGSVAAKTTAAVPATGDGQVTAPLLGLMTRPAGPLSTL